MEITFRPITPNDFEFLWRLHNLALREYVEATWGWDEDVQRNLFADNFDPSKGSIVVVEGADAGYWWLVESVSDILIASIRLLPEFQNRGIGTWLIQNLLGNTDRPVRLQVLKVNPARRLYQRLGFVACAETETHFKMIHEPKRENDIAPG